MEISKFYIVFSVIIAVCALLSPGIVALINNRYQLKLRKLDIEEARRNHAQEIIDGYFRTAGSCIHVRGGENLTEFGKYSNLVFFYMPTKYYSDIKAINEAIRGHDANDRILGLLQTLSTTYAQENDQRTQ